MGRTDGLYTAVQRQMINRMMELAASGKKKKILRAFSLAEHITPENYKGLVGFVGEKVKEDHPALGIAHRVSAGLAPRCRDRFIEGLVVNTLLRGVAKRIELEERTGCRAPTTILVSPTMRCNLACEGCYAAKYSPDEDLDPPLLQRIIDEGNEMGVYLFTLLGGEPFIYDELLEIARANPDSYFQVFTNGTMLTDEVIDQLVEVGNVAPMLSIEGTPEMTDKRRGPGMHAEVQGAMDRLGRAGVLFGYSVTVTRENWRTLVSDDFVDPLIAKGALLAWHFLYMPIGDSPDVAKMLTAEERNEFRVRILQIRDGKSIFPVDFWGDAPYVGGCIAGNQYVHINSEGWVEPCIFTHFATDNIHTTSLLDAFNSPYFREIRSRQPFNENLLMPCMLIDNPRQSREVMACTGARPTHAGADCMLTELNEELDAYSAEVERVYEPVWTRRQEERAKAVSAEAPPV